jgi:hypothetical protein
LKRSGRAKLLRPIIQCELDQARFDGSDADLRDVRGSSVCARDRIPRTNTDTIHMGDVRLAARLKHFDRLSGQHQNVRLEVVIGRRPLKLMSHFPIRHFEPDVQMDIIR